MPRRRPVLGAVRLDGGCEGPREALTPPGRGEPTVFAAGTGSGAEGMVWLRTIDTTVLVARPRVRTYSARHWAYAAPLGLVTAGMNLSFFASAARIPLAVAVAIEFLRPITVAVAGYRRGPHLAWPIAAYAGVLLLTPVGGLSTVDGAGVALALLAAACWGAYVVLTARTSAIFANTAGLTLATTVGAVVLTPIGLLTRASAMLNPTVLLAGFAVSILSTAIPFTVEFAVLRRLPQQVFGVLISAEPAVAALIAWLTLGENPTGIEWAAIMLISAASAGAVLTTHRSARERST
jgi:inner membrane transporter RhtA